ncbi:MAG: hypothetical protein ACQES2_00850 [Pseudomonadota bacterium]
MIWENLLRVATPIAILVPLFYPLYCWGAGKRIKVEPYPVALYMSVTYLAMVILEAAIGFSHTEIFGWRLWEYRMNPNHHGYGTYLGAVMWPFYGLHIYWFKQVMDSRWPNKRHPLIIGLFTSIEGPAFEFFGNGIILILYSQYLFYYFPPELNHLTTVHVMPHYFVAGVCLGYLVNAIEKAPRTWGLPISLYALGLGVTILG